MWRAHLISGLCSVLGEANKAHHVSLRSSQTKTISGLWALLPFPGHHGCLMILHWFYLSLLLCQNEPICFKVVWFAPVFLPVFFLSQGRNSGKMHILVRTSSDCLVLFLDALSNFTSTWIVSVRLSNVPLYVSLLPCHFVTSKVCSRQNCDLAVVWILSCLQPFDLKF